MASRRSVLKAAFGGAVGASTALVPVVSAQAATKSGTGSAQHRLREATLRGARRLGAPSRDLAPLAGDRCVVVADVLARGAAAGVLHADVVRLHNRGQLPEHPDAATLEQHVLVWSEGTLTAAGHCDANGHGRFAITGGTGIYHGAGGSYDLQINRADLGGDGTGRIAFHFTNAHAEA